MAAVDSLEAIRPPEPERGALVWAHRRLFATPVDTAVSLCFGALVLWVAYRIIDWGLIDALWTLDDGQSCRDAAGACWAVIEARGRLILFGLYPYEMHWRSTLACVVIIATMGLSCLPWFWSLKRLPLLWLGGFGLFIVLMRGGVFGLPVVTTEQWGGLSLTVFIFCGVVVLGMPMAVGLALARRSKLPVVRQMTGLFIDFFRSVPLLTILFTAAVVIPLTVPDWAQGDKLGRVIFAFAIFFACYQAEIIRAGMQAIPPGQEEAAAALGMKYWSRMFDIMLPQAFRNALPATINQFVITFKETSIVTIIGFFEIMASANAAIGTGNWVGQYVEVYFFVGLIYFLFVFGLSRYGAYLERRARLSRA